MQVIVCKDYEEVSQRAADILEAAIREKPDCVLGLATGSSPVGMYKELIRRYEAGKLDFSQVQTFNLDEYYPIEPTDPQSYRYFMNDVFFRHINIPQGHDHVPHGYEEAETVCRAYEEMIRKAGGIDLQVLGIGGNGHIAFNEPADTFAERTHVVDLEESTIRANARFFADEADVPRRAVTMGIGTILQARKILLIASGAGKAEALRGMVEGPVTPHLPASALQQHPDVTILADEAAASLLQN